MEDPLLKPREAAAFLGLSVSTLAKYRLSGLGPVFVKAGMRLVRYRLSSVESWLRTRSRQSTSDSGRPR
jgi:predicted DNA-binding transcriptional regulator AlpA